MHAFFLNPHVVRGTLAVSLLIGAFGVNATFNTTTTVPLPDGVAIFGQKEVKLDRDVNVLAGDVASNGDVELDRDVFVEGSAIGDEVELERGVRILGNLEANKIKTGDDHRDKNGERDDDKNHDADKDEENPTSPIVEGETIIPRQTTDFQMPAIPPFTPGTNNLAIKKGETAIIQPGSYHNIAIGAEAKVTVTGGTYNLRSLKSERDAVLTFIQPVTVNVAQTFAIERHVIFNLDPTLDINQIQINFTGTNTVKIERDSFIAGELLAPNAAFFLGHDSIFRGQIAAKRIGVGKDTIIARETGFMKRTDPEKVIVDVDGSVFPVNEILVNFTGTATILDSQRIAAHIGGNIAGFMDIANAYKIEVSASTALELDGKIQAIEQLNEPLVEGAFENFGLSLE